MGQPVNQIKTNFSSGEVSPGMGGRVDVTRHKNGAAVIENFVIRPQGGLSRRMGTGFKHEVKDSLLFNRLIPFQASNLESFVLEFGDETLRFIKNGAQVLNVGVPYEIVSPYTSDELPDLMWAQSADVLYITHPNHPPKRLSKYGDTNWVIEDAPLEDGPYLVSKESDKEITMWFNGMVHRGILKSTNNDFVVGDVGKFVEFWREGNLIIGEIKTFTSATEVIVEPRINVVDRNSLDYKAVIDTNAGPTKIRSSLSIWSSETEYNYIKVNGVWYYMTTHDPIPAQVGTPPAAYIADNMIIGSTPTMVTTTGILTFSDETINAGLFIKGSTWDASRDVGRSVRLYFNKQVVWGKITSIFNPSHAIVALGTPIPRDPRDQSKFINDATTTNWRLGAFYTGNYPRAVTLHQGRLTFAGTAAEPYRFWMSRSDDFVSFAPSNIFSEVLDDSAINYGVNSGEVNSIVWLQSGPVLLIGTIGEEFQVKPSSLSEPLTPTNINIMPQTPYGSVESVRPIKIGTSTLFIERHGQKLRKMVYSFEIDSFTASDVTVVSEHIFRKHGAAINMAYQQAPNSTIWFICEDGKFVSLTYEEEQQVYAWSNHALVDGIVESIASIPNNETQDEVWMVVRRTINNSTKRYVEKLADDFYPTSPTDKNGMHYLDCAVLYDGAPTATITGLDHLEGQVVSVLADNAVHPERTVELGQITLAHEASRVLVGINFISKVQTVSDEGGSQNGSLHGKNRKITHIDIQVLDSLGFKYGEREDSATVPTSFRSAIANMGESPPLQSDFFRTNDESGFRNNSQFWILQDQPYPLNILALMPVLKVQE